MRIYLMLWLFLTGLLGYEYTALTYKPAISLLHIAQAAGYFSQDEKWSTAPGRTLSLWLGWIGFSLMVLMNVYSMRKRFEFLQNLGRLSHWLNFHIFCGILGPTLIFFHCGLKVRGVVGISFWSMIVSLTSGIIGRYFFVQLSAHRSEFEELADKALEKLQKYLDSQKIEVLPEKRKKVLDFALSVAGGNISGDTRGPFSTFWATLEGDIRLSMSDLPVPRTWPLKTRRWLLSYALNKRRSQSLESFEKLMGYWHTFHFPFAIFMYIAAIIHIISSLIFLGHS